LAGTARLKSKILSYIWEIGKWILVLFLLYPLISTMSGPVNFSRVVIGEALLIIFIGKIFYDTIIWKFTNQRKAAGQDFISLIGILLTVSFILVLFLVLFALTLRQYMVNQTAPF
jgi:predicted ABC-type exoprotein transport system permease subunit